MEALRLSTCLLILLSSFLVLAASGERLEQIAPAGGVTYNPIPSSIAPSFEIEEEFVPVPAERQALEEADYAVESSSSGFARFTRVGIRVTQGASATMNYDVTVTAVSADILQKADKAFLNTLTEREIPYYDRLKDAYEGGLNVSWLWWLGINLNKTTTRERMDYAASRQSDYAERSAIAKEILQSFTSQKIRVSGSLKVTGIGDIPQEAFAFVKVGVVKFQDGSRLNVISSDKNDVTGGTLGGEKLPTDNVDLNFFPTP